MNANREPPSSMTVPAFKKTLAVCLVLALAGGCASAAKDESKILFGFLNKAAVSSELSGDHVSAANHYQNLLDRQPDNKEILLGLARNLRYTGGGRTVVEIMKIYAVKYSDDPAFLIEFGKAKLAVSEAQGAIQYLKKAIEKGGDDWQAYSAIGIGYDLLQSYAEAWEAYEKALALSGNNPAVINNMAISAALNGKLPLAISILEDAPLEARRYPQIRLNLALFYGIKGDLKKAEALAKMDLDDEAVRNNMAGYKRFYAKRGKTPPQ